MFFFRGIQTVLFIFYFQTSLVFKVSGADEDCKIDDVIDQIQQLSITDKNVSVDIFKSGTTEIKEIKLESPMVVLKNIIDSSVAQTYFNWTLSTDPTALFSLKTTSSFKNVNKDAYTNGEALQIIINLSLECINGQTNRVSFIITVNDTMSNIPIFTTESLEYSVPMPIMPLTDFSVYGSLLQAEDLNFANTKLNFAIDPPTDFDITSVQVANKTFKAAFAAKSLIQITESKIYTITVKDSNSNQNSAKITILKDKRSSLDVPSFSKGFYTFSYNASDDSAPFKNTGEDIHIASEKPADLSCSDLEGSYKEYFKRTLTGQIVTISLSEKTLPTDFELISLTLSCKSDVATTTTLLVTNVQKKSEDKTLFFQAGYYTYKYEVNDSTPALTLVGSSITLVNKNSVDIRLSLDGEYKAYFEQPTIQESTVGINLVKGKVLPTKAGSLIQLQLICQSDNIKATTDIVISVAFYTNGTSEADLFTRNYYSFNYTDNESSASLVANDGDITINTTKSYSPSDLKLSGGYSEYFSIEKITPVSEKNQAVVQIASKILPNETKSTIILTLTLPSQINTSIIILNDKNTSVTPPIPKFSQTYFSGKYDPGKDQVTLDNEIDAANVVHIDILQDSKIAAYFSVQKNNSKFEVICNKSFPSELISDKTNFILTLVASSQYGTSYSPLIINLPLPAANNAEQYIWYLVAVIVLAILLFSTILAAVVLWYFKQRTKTENKKPDEETNKNPTFVKKSSAPKLNPKIDDVVRRPTGFASGTESSFTPKKEPGSYPDEVGIDIDSDRVSKTKDSNDNDDDGQDSENGSLVPSRRATGFVFNPPPPEDDEIPVENHLYQSELSPKADRKSVAFENAEDNENRGKSEKISQRRPTTFSFGYPLEEGIFNNDESSDNPVPVEKERKKSVAFNDKVERMHVEKNNIDDSEEEPSTITTEQLI